MCYNTATFNIDLTFKVTIKLTSLLIGNISIDVRESEELC